MLSRSFVRVALDPVTVSRVQSPIGETQSGVNGLYDTVKLRSPGIDEAVAERISNSLDRLQLLHVGTGELVYEITRGGLVGTYDHRISVRVEHEWLPSAEGALPVRVPRLVVECSVHKAMVGHNVGCGPVELLPACRWLIQRVGSLVGETLPDGGVWDLLRVDVAECYDLGSLGGVRAYLWAMTQARYPRRRVDRYGVNGIMAPGTHTSIKLYAKGPEFRVHDRPRLMLAGVECVEIQERADRLLRVEVEIKARALRKLGEGRRVCDVSDEWLREAAEMHVLKLVSEAEGADIVRTVDSVSERLYAQYPSALAVTLYASWVQLVAQGEEKCRQMWPRSSFYRRVSQLKAAGVSWLGSDARLVRSDSVPDFSPTRGSALRLVESDARILECLAQVA